MSKAVKYIETGITSCPLLPDNWEIKKLKYLAKVQTGRTPSIQGAKVDFFENGEINWFTPADFGNERYLDNSSRKVNQLALDNAEIQLFPNHSIYLVSIGATLGKIGISEKSGSANQQINVISFYDVINPVFGFYFLKSISSNLINEVDFTTLPILNQSKTKDIFIPFPSITTQEIIANFLDQKTAEIDNLISKKQKLIAYLIEEKIALINKAVTKGLNSEVETKFSGNKWLGNVPANWEVKKIKYVSKVQGRVGFKGYSKQDIVTASEGALTIGAKHIQENKIYLNDPEYISWEKYYESPEIFVEKGQILVVQRGSLGKVAIIDEELGEATINPSMVILKNLKINPKYLFYLLSSAYFSTFIDLANASTAVPMISQEQLENWVIPKPNDDEMEKIVEFIEEKVSIINKTIIHIEQEIYLIKEYKASLINEVVTGKITLN